MVTIRRLSAALGVVCTLGIGTMLVACNSVANVDLTYTDAGESAANEAGPGLADGGAGPADASVFPVKDANALVTTTTVPCQGADGSTCDQTEGQGCCVPSSGAAPFCVDQETAKTACSSGVFMGCVKSDVTSESLCCWNGSGAGAFTAYAASCGARPVACSTNDDCPIGIACNTISCHGSAVGACGSTPVCP